MMDEMALFTSSVDLSSHPMRNVKIKLKKQYCAVLEELVKKQINHTLIDQRFKQYQERLLKKTNISQERNNIKEAMQLMINSPYHPWRKKYRYWLLCDAAIILMDEALLDNVALEMESYLSELQRQQFQVLRNALKDDRADIEPVLFAKNLISQYRRNKKFANTPIQRYIVTANMSAGKSTLINALIGKPLTKTSQEVCTGNICYIFNKPYEDGRIHYKNQKATMDAGWEELKEIAWDAQIGMASYFRGTDTLGSRVCIIDTPGVNSSINRNHGNISRDALLNQPYDKAIYVLNANKLGTEEEIAHIRWVSENVPRDKVIFVLNKVDDFNAADDNIDESIEGVKKDLISLGFESPVIYPISAYFALLIKMRANGDELSEDEKDEYSLYLKKFKKPAYDLSKYYGRESLEKGNDSERTAMSKRCGLYGLEKILFGGIR